MAANILASFVESYAADGAGNRGLKFSPAFNRARIGRVQDRRSRRAGEQGHVGRSRDGDRVPGRGCFQIDAVVDGAGEDRIGASNLWRPAVRPRLIASYRMPA